MRKHFASLIVISLFMLLAPATLHAAIATPSQLLPWVESSSHSSFSSAHAAAASRGVGILISTNMTISTGTTVTVPVQVVKGGMLTKSGSGTLTINGPFSAEAFPVFSGFSAGDVTIAADSVEQVYPQWWGALGDDSADDSTAFLSAIAAHRRVYLLRPSVRYYVASNIPITNDGQVVTGSKSAVRFGGTHGFELTGTTSLNTSITVTATVDTFSLTVASTASYAAGDVIVLHDVSANEYEINRVAYIGSGTVLYTQNPITYAFGPTGGSLLKKANTVKDVEISNLQITNPSNGMAIYTTYAENLHVHDNVFHDLYSSAVSETVSIGTRIIGNSFYNCGTGGSGPAIGLLMSRNGTIKNNSHANQQIDEDISLFKRCWGYDIIGNKIGQQQAVATGGHGIVLTQRCSYNSIKDNVIYRVTGSGIMLTVYGGVGNNRRNTITGNLVQGCSGAGIRLLGASGSDNTNNIIRDNELIANGGYGLQLDNTNSYNTLSNNVYSGNASGDFLNQQTANYLDVAIKSNIQALVVGANQKADVRAGTGSPEGVLSLQPGSVWLREDGAAGSTIYSKESGTGNTGWSALASVATSTITSAPTYTGQMAVVSGAAYISTGTTSTTNWRQSTAEVFYTQATPSTSVTGTTTETTLYSTTIPGGSMGTTGTLELQTLFNITGSTNAKTMKAYVGGANISTNIQAVAANVAFRQYALLINDNSLVSQLTHTSTSIGASTIPVTTTAIDTAADQTLTITGTLANTGETITLKYVGITVKRGD